jgi:hypothetical protein
MNTNPADETIILWLEDELSDSELPAMEKWAKNQPDFLAKRDSLRVWCSQLKSVIPSDSEPPYADFFQTKLLRSIEESQDIDENKKGEILTTPFWRKLILPFTVAAALGLAFLGGTKFQNINHSANTLVIYTPEKGVNAEYFSDSPSNATVIVLNGVDAISDHVSDVSLNDAKPENKTVSIQENYSAITSP